MMIENIIAAQFSSVLRSQFVIDPLETNERTNERNCAAAAHQHDATLTHKY